MNPNDAMKPLTVTALRDLKTNEERMDKIFSFTDNNCLIVNVVYPYEVDLDRLPTPAHLIGWVRHLSKKTWMSTDLIAEFIDRVCQTKGWDPHL